MNFFSRNGRRDDSAFSLLQIMIVTVIIALLSLCVVQALDVKQKDFPTFTGTTLGKAGNAGLTNTASGATYTNTDPRETALKLTHALAGYPTAVTITYTCASAVNSNVVVGFAPSANGTNYSDALGDMFLVTVPGTGGANTNRSFTTNFPASTVGASIWWSVRHQNNINTAALSGFRVTAGLVQ